MGLRDEINQPTQRNLQTRRVLSDIGQGLTGRGGQSPVARDQEVNATRRFELGGIILAGIESGSIPQEEGAQALEGLGPEFQRFIGQGGESIINKAPAKGLKSQSRNIIDTKTGDVIGQGFFDPASGQTTFQDGRRLEPGQIGIAGLLRGGKSEFKSTNKLQNKNIEDEQATRSTVLLLEGIKEKISSDDFVGGFSGDMLSVINSAGSQMRQLTGNDSILKNGKIDESQLELSKENMSFVRRAAINNDRVDSAIIELAYILAKMRDPGGRVSDKDLDAATNTIESGADKASILNLLSDTQKRGIIRYNSNARTLNRRSGASNPLLDMDEILGGSGVSYTGQPDQIADDILKSEGL